MTRQQLSNKIVDIVRNSTTKISSITLQERHYDTLTDGHERMRCGIVRIHRGDFINGDIEVEYVDGSIKDVYLSC